MAQILTGAMDLLHDQSLPTISALQSSFRDNKDFMINISTLFDPRYVFLIYAPILYALNKRVGHRMIAALTLTEWANQILKWLLAGERPYWYVHERASELANATLADAHAHAHLFRAAALPALKQFPVTCELGAGSPSGHAMVTATVWYILIDAYLKGELRVLSRVDYAQAAPASFASAEHKLAKLSWCVYTAMLVLVSLSRVYLACHFPHQCLGGAVLGLVVARLVVERLPMERLSSGHFGAATLAMFATALSTYAILRSLGVDPLWSVGKGMRWCAKKEYIHLDTTPFFSMMRYLGFCLGAGLAYSRAKAGPGGPPASAKHNSTRHLLAARVVASLAAIAFGQALLSLPLPRSNMNLFYAISFAVYTLFSYAIAGPIPTLAKRLTAPGAKTKAH